MFYLSFHFPLLPSFIFVFSSIPSFLKQTNLLLGCVYVSFHKQNPFVNA